MRGQRIFAIASSLVSFAFYVVVVGCAINFVLRTYRVVTGDADVTNVHKAPLSFEVKSFGPFDSVVMVPNTYSKGKEAALVKQTDRFQLLVACRSPLGIYDYFLNLLAMAALVYGMWQLRSIFRSITVKEPFTPANARRIRNIGLLLIGADVVKLINYFIFGSMAKKYFVETELLTDIGGGIWIGALVLALSVVYQRGVEIYSDNQLTI